MRSITRESVLDFPKESLDPSVWREVPNKKPVLTNEAAQKLQDIVQWAQQNYDFNDLSVYIIGSICSNSYNENSDIDIDFCAPDAIEDGNDEEAVKEFGWKFKDSFMKDYAEKFPDKARVGTHPFEVYFSPNPFQCFMSIGCYNVLEKKWEVGPELKREGFDPIAEYYFDAMKQVDKILKDVRDKIFSIYEKAIVASKSNDQEFKDQQEKDIVSLLSEVSDLFQLMKKVRSNYQRPCKSKEEALKRRKDKKQHIVDAAFKFFDKFGYMHILKDFIDIYYSIKDGESSPQDELFNAILKSVKDNISLKSLQDSEDAEFLQTLDEADLDESARDLVKMSVIAAMMAIPSLLPANALAKELSRARKPGIAMTVNSNAAKKAIENAAIGNEMLGTMSKTNVVNAIAKVLWKEARGAKEGIDGRKAVASIILNRTGNDPTTIVDVLKEKKAFSCLNNYFGGWTDTTYQWFVPWKEIKDNPANKAIWDECNALALQLTDKKFKSTIGNCNSYLNKKTADKNAVESWGKKCNLQVGSHHFGYLPEHDPKYVKPGTMVTWKEINAKTKPLVVVVKNGDTLGKIAKDNKTTVDKILSLNKAIKDPNKISVGQKIRVA